jgi:hypothetical protein
MQKGRHKLSGVPLSYVTGYNGGTIELHKKPGRGVPVERMGYMGHFCYYSQGMVD